MSKIFRAKVTGNTTLSDNYNLLTLSPETITEPPRPGQFYLIRASDSLDPLLRRPFSILRCRNGSLEFLIRLKGKGTHILRELSVGTETDLLGPLGKGYPVPGDDEAPLLIAGGIGIASLYSLLENEGSRAYLFYGAMRALDLCLLNDISGITGRLYLSTDDGSTGFKGDVVNNLADFLDHFSIKNPVVYACGPPGMLISLKNLLKRRGIKGFFSLEERMACGVGACLGCVVKTREGYRCSCTEGPVFDMDELGI